MKKNLPMLVGTSIVLLILLAAGGIILLKGNKKVSQPTGNPFPTRSPVVVADRPYVRIIPRSDGHELAVEVSNIKNTQSADYELVYLVGDLQRGVIGSVDLKDQSSFVRNLLLGSCSKNVCKYDEGIEGGTLTLRFRSSLGTEKYEVPFSLYGGKTKGKTLTSSDGKFSFQGSSPSNAFIILSSSEGIPKSIESEIVGGPYGIFTSGSASVKGNVKILLNKSTAQTKVFSWDQSGMAWIQLSKGFAIDGESVSFDIDRFSTFIVTGF